MPIYTVGYENLAPEQLARCAAALGAVVVDCRTKAWGRVKLGFGREHLREMLGGRYVWRGSDLGGRGAGPTGAGVDWLIGLESEPAPLLLVCKEEPPGDCHRHHRIALPLAARGVEVRHIYRDEVFTATELQRAIVAVDDYATLDEASPLAAYYRDGEPIGSAPLFEAHR
jgi:hypothetical protein